LGQPTPYLAVIDLLRRYFGIEPRDAEPGIREKVERRLGELDPSLGHALPALLSLFDVRVEDAAWQVLDPVRRQQTLDAIRRLMLRGSGRQPLVLVFEDAHWADSETRALLEAVADGLPASRVLMLITHRPEYRHEWGGRTFYTQLRVDPLRGEHAEELLHGLLGADPPLASLKRQLIEWTDGNPFFVEETVRTLAETGVLAGRRGAYALARPVTGITVPDTVEAVLAGRMARLGPVTHEVLRSAAAVGRQVPHDVLAAVSKLSEPELRESLERLVAGEFLYEAATSAEREYAFRHALTHEVAYANLTEERRRALHAAAMEALSRIYAGREGDKIGELAHHAFEGRVWDRAIGYLRQAGRRAFARSANREAVDCFTQALTALSHVPQERVRLEEAIDVRFDMRSALWPLGKIDRMGTVLGEAAALAYQLQDLRRQGLVATARCHYFFLTSRHAEAVAAGEEAVRLARAMGNRALECDATLYMVIVHGATALPSPVPGGPAPRARPDAEISPPRRRVSAPAGPPPSSCEGLLTQCTREVPPQRGPLRLTWGK
jgi:predicted ATPase